MASEEALTVPQPEGRVVVVMPVYNDWESAAVLLRELAHVFQDTGTALRVVMVDDCSTMPCPDRFCVSPVIESVTCVRLAANVGHQRAIAVGLSTLRETSPGQLVAVMDSDGEDRPDELRRLLDTARSVPGRILVAQRKKRSETALFRAFYRVYVLMFRLLTGQRINFGNFTVVPASLVPRLVNDHNIWNHFAAAIVRARLPVEYVPTRRGTRYAGQSRMNFVGLVAHGLGAMSVFSEAVFIRILLASAALLTLSGLLAAVALFMKLFTTLALPNWATTVLGFALVITIQALMLPILMAFVLLNSRGVVHPLPSTMIPQLIASVTDVELDRA